jgi:hypothetical protein
VKPTEAYWGGLDPEPLQWPYAIANCISWLLLVDGSFWYTSK